MNTVTWVLAGIGLLQGMLIFLYSLIWTRLGKVDDEFRAHIQNNHAHGNGMPRAEVEARITALSAQIGMIATDARGWFNENRDDHKEIRASLDEIKRHVKEM